MKVLRKALDELSIDYDDEKIEKLSVYFEEINKSSKNFNLTSLKTWEEIRDTLFIRSLRYAYIINTIFSKSNFLNSKNLRILDLGTGSGCLIISALEEFEFSRGLGIDISKKAISIAKKNKDKINKKLNLSFYVHNFFTIDTNEFDIIICNPPYVPREEFNKIQDEVISFEPHTALFSQYGTKDCYQKIITNIKTTNKKTCHVFFEIDYFSYIMCAFTIICAFYTSPSNYNKIDHIKIFLSDIVISALRRLDSCRCRRDVLKSYVRLSNRATGPYGPIWALMGPYGPKGMILF